MGAVFGMFLSGALSLFIAVMIFLIGAYYEEAAEARQRTGLVQFFAVEVTEIADETCKSAAFRVVNQRDRKMALLRMTDAFTLGHAVALETDPMLISTLRSIFGRVKQRGEAAVQRTRAAEDEVVEDEWITYADVAFLNDSLFCAGTPPIPAPTTSGPDPTTINQKGFDRVDVTYGATANANVTATTVDVALHVTTPVGTPIKGATLILEFSPLLTPAATVFTPAAGVTP